jgi:hypothetical protein
MLGEHAATTAVPYSTHRVGQRNRKRIGAITVALKQMKRNTLGRFLADTGHAAQAVDKANK